MTPPEHRSFGRPEDLRDWLKERHATDRELWVRIFKKASGTPSVTWDDCVLACLCWGWIDGQRKALDDVSFLQRLTPRRPRSNWSSRNIEHAERLIAANRMQPSGWVQIEMARNNGFRFK